MAPTLITSGSHFTRGYLAGPITEAPNGARLTWQTCAQTAPNIEVEIADAD